MSIQHKDVENIQGSSVQEAGPLQTGSPPLPPSPRPPQGPPRPTPNRWVVLGTVIVLLAVILSLGGIWLASVVQQPGSQVKPTPTAPVTTTTPTPGVSPSPQPSPPGVNTTAYWDKIIGTQKGKNQVERVTLTHLMDNASTQALVSVHYTGSDSLLDVYVFTNITNAHPKQVFKLAGLVKGNVKISGYNTVVTAEVDKNSGPNVGKAISAMKADLFREFDWSSNQGAFVQVAFPGIFPDLTRWQAEVDQLAVNQGKDTWKNDPAQVAKALASKFFGWQHTITTKVISGGGPHDVNATVQVQEPPLPGAQSQGPSALVTLSRLEGNTANMWVAIGVKDGTMLTLTNIPARSRISSPVTLQGTGAAFEGVIGHAVIYDHLYTGIGDAQVTGSNGMGIVSYSTKVSYTSSFKGAQEGIVTVYEANGGISSENYTVVMIKVLING
ncbi:MAG TPA: hypothetical protein VJ761_09400 [Ktedonobacteraceae bacterium]|nr:hypothetical protein [Ktedonobacteraceae bacterium]